MLSRVPPQSDVGVDVTELSPQSESTDVQTEAENAAYLPYSPIPNLATNVPVRQNSAYLPYSHGAASCYIFGDEQQSSILTCCKKYNFR